MTDYMAVSIAEGFGEGEDATIQSQLEAWSHLIRTGLAYQLQGFFGRYAADLIRMGIISSEGEINWENVNL